MGRRGPKVSEKQKAEVINLLEQHYSVHYVAEHVGISESEVRKIGREARLAEEQKLARRLGQISAAIDVSKLLCEVRDLLSADIQGVSQYLFQLSQECHAPEVPILGTGLLPTGTLMWSECPAPCGLHVCHARGSYGDLCKSNVRDYKLSVGKRTDGKWWLRLPSRGKYPNFEAMFPIVRDFQLYRSILAFEEMGGYYMDLCEQVMVLLGIPIDETPGGHDTEIGRQLKPNEVNSMRTILAMWKQYGDTVRGWGELLKPA